DHKQEHPSDTAAEKSEAPGDPGCVGPLPGQTGIDQVRASKCSCKKKYAEADQDEAIHGLEQLRVRRHMLGRLMPVASAAKAPTGCRLMRKGPVPLSAASRN